MQNTKSTYPWWYCRKDSQAGKGLSKTGRILLQSLCSFAGAALFYFKFHLPIVSGILAAMGLFVVISGFLAIRIYDAFNRLVNLAAFGVGQALTWLLLAPFYYICIFPARLILLCAGRDPMQRKWSPEQASYWEEKHGGNAPEELTRQY